MGTVSVEIIQQVAEQKGISAAELPPLYEALDPDALDELVTAAPRDTELAVQFQYEGYTVTVTDRGNIDISPDS